MVVVPSNMPAEVVRPAADHRRLRNVTRLIGTLRRTSIPTNHQVDLTPLEVSSENAESSMPRVKKKIKHKRMWDEPEAQASEIQNATTKRPDRIKTRRRLVPSSSTTVRALRTAVVLQEDPYYDFGKKIRNPLQSSTVGFSILGDLETRTSVKSPIVVATTEEDTSEADVEKPTVERVSSSSSPRTRTQLNRSHNSTSNHRRPENLAECIYPRFIRRNNKSRSRRDVRCVPTTSESDARTTRILSTVVTSVSVKGNQKKNDTSAESGLGSAGDATTNDEYSTVVSLVTAPSSTTTTTTSSPEPAAVSGHPKYLRNRYRNISLPEYLEITKVNQRRLNVTTVTAEATRPTTSVKVTSTNGSTTPFGSTEIVEVPTTVVGGPSFTDTSSPPTDLQDFIYLNNGTSETPADTTSNPATVEARQRRPLRNLTRQSTEHDVGVVYPEGLATSTYFLTFLAIVPLVLVIVFAFKLAIQRKKKKVFDSSEYSSEYNRSPLDFNTITSSPITTKLPRVPQHIVWDSEKTTPPTVPLPAANSRWEFPRDKLRLQTILGQGNFGQVWKAEADDISGHEGLTRLVAVKMVKEDAASREREDLIRELSIMQHLGSHPNVVTLLGCCTEKGTREWFYIYIKYVIYI